jgi:HEAT repeat protein
MRHKLCVVGFLFLVSIMMSSCESQDRKIESLIKQLELSSQSPADLLALGRIGQPAVPALIEALSDESSRFRQRAVWALGRIGGSEALSPLVKALSDETTAVGIMAVWALKSVGEPAVPALIN